MQDAVNKLNTSDIQERVRKSIQKKGGSVTLGEIISETGIPKFEAERALKALLSSYEGHLKVGEKGDLIYVFNPHLIRRDHRSFWERSKERAYKIFKVLFKIWIMITLIFYFILYLAIIIALIFGNRNSNNSSSSSSGGLNPLFIYWLFWGRGDYESSRNRYGEPEKPRVPFNKRIFQFVFGPEEEKKDPLELQKTAAQLIKSNRGVIGLEDWIMVSGHEKKQAESELAHFTAIFDGEAEITDDGQLIYSFPEMMRSEKNKALPRAPQATWNKLEDPRPLTGNTTGSNVGIFLLNSFNLIMSAIFAFSFFQTTPEMMLEYGVSVHPAMPIVLGYFPLFFSLIFFLVPFIRSFSNRGENKKRRKRNIRRVLLRNVFTSTASEKSYVSSEKALVSVDSALKKASMNASNAEEIKEDLRSLVIDFDGEPEAEDSGEIVYKFSELKKTMEMVGRERKRLALDEQKIGEIVFDTTENYSSNSSESRAEDRELAEFSSMLDAEINYTRQR